MEVCAPLEIPIQVNAKIPVLTAKQRVEQERCSHFQTKTKTAGFFLLNDLSVAFFV